MKNRPNSDAVLSSAPLVRELAGKIANERKRVDATRRESKIAKLELKNARRKAKQAKKLSREARKALKGLKRELKKALAAAQLAAAKKSKQAQRKSEPSRAATKAQPRRPKRRKPGTMDRDAAAVAAESFNVGSAPAKPAVDLSGLTERGRIVAPPSSEASDSSSV